ncbi:MAG TPA: hypothetical protein VF614_09590 [Chthoniobacteraceae bacterium]|jgi:hypothetical protein
MKRILLQVATLALAVTGFSAHPAQLLDKANPLPLALDDSFQFRKTKVYLNDPQLYKPSIDQMINFERQRINFGAVNQYDRQERQGHYFTFFWRAKRPSDVTVRLEYRQAQLGAYVQAQELSYKGARGTIQSNFRVIGDDYRQEGKITAWRALIIENGRIVGLNQSFLWN